MKSIPLTKGAVTFIDTFDFETFGRMKWCLGPDGAAVRSARFSDGTRKLLFLHRLVALAREGEHVHHLDHDPLNNTRANLVVMSKSQHDHYHQLVAGPKQGLYRGVCWDRSKNKWVARLKVETKRIYLGHFKSREDAARAWDKAALIAFGPDVFQNFP